MPEFILTSVPPSVNGMYANAKCGRIKTRKYRDWIRGELNALVAQRAQAVPWPVTIGIVLAKTTRGDCDNRAKAALDLLVTAGIIPNDSTKYVRQVLVAIGSTDQTRIIVESAECPV